MVLCEAATKWMQLHLLSDDHVSARIYLSIRRNVEILNNQKLIIIIMWTVGGV